MKSFEAGKSRTEARLGFKRLLIRKLRRYGGYTDENDGNGYYAVPDFEVNNAHLQQSIYQGIHDSGE